jgi:hypothetical protein
MKKFLAVTGLSLLATPAFAGDTYTSLYGTVSPMVADLLVVVGTACGAGLGIFALIWGIKKIKQAIKSGA